MNKAVSIFVAVLSVSALYLVGCGGGSGDSGGNGTPNPDPSVTPSPVDRAAPVLTGVRVVTTEGDRGTVLPLSEVHPTNNEFYDPDSPTWQAVTDAKVYVSGSNLGAKKTNVKAYFVGMANMNNHMHCEFENSDTSQMACRMWTWTRGNLIGETKDGARQYKIKLNVDGKDSNEIPITVTP